MEYPTGTLVRWLLHRTPLDEEDPENGPLDAAEDEGRGNPPTLGAAFSQKGRRLMRMKEAIQVALSATSPRDLNLDGLMVHMLAVQYADPKDHAFPIDREHIHAAIDYFGKYAHRYPKDLQREMAKRILRAALRYHVEVSPQSKVRQIAEGHVTEHGDKHPGTSKVADEAHKEGGIESSNGPSGPHPFPQEVPPQREADHRDVGNLDLFHMIRELQDHKIEKPDMAASAELLALVNEMGHVIESSH